VVNLILIFLHVMTMFVAVALALGGSIFLVMALRTGRTEVVRSYGSATKSIVRIIPVVFVIGGIFGLITAVALQFNLLAPWLIIAYILFALLALSGAALSGPAAENIGKIVATAPNGPLPAAAAPLIDRFYRAQAIEVTVLVLIVFDMVVKPFG